MASTPYYLGVDTRLPKLALAPHPNPFSFPAAHSAVAVEF